MSILKTILTFVEKIEFVGVKTTQLNIYPGEKKNSDKIGQLFFGIKRLLGKNRVNLPKNEDFF